MVTTPEALFATHRQGLFRYLCRAVGEVDAARDLTQEVFLRVTRSPIPASPADQLRGWIFKIARNLALDHHRERGRRPAAAELNASPMRPASQDVGAAVNEALAKLTDVDRDVFLMREVAGLGYDDIAAACGLTPDAVRSRIHRARLQLRDMLSAPIAIHRRSPMRAGSRTFE